MQQVQHGQSEVTGDEELIQNGHTKRWTGKEEGKVRKRQSEEYSGKAAGYNTGDGESRCTPEWTTNVGRQEGRGTMTKHQLNRAHRKCKYCAIVLTSPELDLNCRNN